MAPLAEAFVRLRPDLASFKGEADKGIAGAGLGKAGDQQGKAFGRQFGAAAGKTGGETMSSKLTDAVKKLGPGLLAAAGGLGVVEVFKRVIGGASDLNETVSKSQQVFGASAGEILKWSKTAASSMGLSQRAALDGASSFQNLFSQIGITGKAATGMSKNLVQLASDFASFHNAAPEEVMDALLSATRGEYDALQRFVPTVTAAAIETEALAESGKKSATQLTNAEKATALYNLVVQGAGAATGDFARTSTGAANQQRILVAKLEDTAASIGSHVLPAYQDLLKVVNTIGPGTIIAAAGVAVLSNRIAASGGGAGVFQNLRASYQLYSEAVASGTPRVTAALETAKASTVGLRAAGSSLVGLFGGPWGLALTAATVGLGLFLQKSAKTRAQIEELTGSFVPYRAALQDTGKEQAAHLRTLLESNKGLRGFAATANELGLSQQRITAGLEGDVDARNFVIGAINEQINAEKLAAAQARGSSESETVASKAHLDRAAALEQQRIAFAKANTAAHDATVVADESVSKTGALTAAQQGLRTELDLLHKAQTAMNDAQATAADRAGALKTAYDTLFGPAINLTEANEAWEASFDALSVSVAQNSRSLDIHTAAGRQNRDAIEGTLTALAAQDQAELASGATIQIVTAHHAAHIEELRKEAIRLGLNKTETEKLITTYGQIPTDVDTTFTQQNAAVVKAAFDGILSDVQFLLANGFLPIRGGSTAPVGKGKRAFAAGGLFRGAGSRTSDSNLAWISDMEYVAPAHAVDFYGPGVFDAMREHKVPKGLFAGYARGGLAGRPGRQAGSGSQPFYDLQGELGVLFSQAVTEVIRQQVIDAAKAKVAAQIAASAGGGQLGAWIAAGMRATGVPAAWAGPLRTLIMRESGGNPRSINLTDINAQRGDPSRGLMQTIGGTFARYRLGSLPNDIYDPVANIAAGIRYILARYGTIFNVQQAVGATPRGYAAGGLVPGPIGRPQPAVVHGGERVLSSAEQADGIRLDNATISRLAQAMSARPVIVQIEAPGWDLATAGVLAQ